jgi:hypothetical protein
MNSQNKEKDLLQLHQFCQQTNITGWCANVWYNGLIIRYPFHFLIYSQNSDGNEWRKDKAKQNIKRELVNKIDKILSMTLEEKDIVAYEKLMSNLDDFILRTENNKQ